ncbi:eukaryotic translation initiation factor 4 gamma [Strigomonas culicis]|nr:eukaryotic translation initiation factor 4 gamma [Strigomonas culicis]|eukprot:EPY27727.1 eukaryotic translation initiation factor 4 gamma [Strigomonas culicis]
MTISDILAFRDTWTAAPEEGFSLEKILLRAAQDRAKKAEVPKLVLSDHGFKIRSRAEMDEAELELRRVQATLNKLSEDNYDAVVAELMTPKLIYEPDILKGAVNIIFSKAVAEPVFSGLYARLCGSFVAYEKTLLEQAKADPNCYVERMIREREERRGNEKDADVLTRAMRVGDTVRVALVLRCQDFFSTFVEQPPAENEESVERLRRQNLANIKFVGELYLRSLVKNSVVTVVSLSALNLADTLMLNLRRPPGKPVTDVDVEMVISLLNVVGKQFDERTPESEKAAVWKGLENCQNDPKISKRIHFLLQNLLEWRKSGYKPKDTTPMTSSSANTEPAHNINKNAHAKPNQGRSMDRNLPSAHSLSHMDGSANRRGLENLRHPDSGNLSQAPAAAGAAGGAVPQLNEEEMKLASLALPPKTLNAEMEKMVLAIARACAEEDNYASAQAGIVEAIGKEDANTALMSAVFIVAKRITQTNKEAESQLLTTFLQKCTVLQESLLRGLSWCLCNAISHSLSEDYPRLFSRFCVMVASLKCLPLSKVCCNIMIRTAHYLDSLIVMLEGDEETWQEEFLNVWSLLLTEWKKSRGDDINSQDVVEQIGQLKPKPFMSDVMPDFVNELLAQKVLSHQDLSNWLKKVGKKKGEAFCEHLRQFYPTLMEESCQ